MFFRLSLFTEGATEKVSILITIEQHVLGNNAGKQLS
jgi:hypothetical protein